VAEQAAAGQAPAPFRVLFVCLGNICRSPTAEGTMRALVREAGMEGQIELDSAGTGSWHVGSSPDERARAAAAGRGIALGGAARQVSVADFDDFNLMIAMDSANLGDLRELASDDEQRAKIRLLREFDPAGVGTEDLDVPDPYYGPGDGFERVLDMVEASCRGLLAQIEAGELR
jgi:protein-tyrosine phosphatase